MPQLTDYQQFLLIFVVIVFIWSVIDSMLDLAATVVKGFFKAASEKQIENE